MVKYTVIIPTRNRAETLDATLRSCLRQSYTNFEIIVSDNCSSDNTEEVVKRHADPRLRYINPGKRLSMSGNFEFSLNHANSGFVMFIGADDAIMPDAVEYVDSIVNKYGVQAVSCRQATYVWPDFPDSNIAGRLILEGVGSTKVEIRESDEWIRRALRFDDSYCFELPNLYCGFVHTDVIEKARKDGLYFRSVTPDAYSAFATAIFVQTYAFSRKPFAIAGASRKSNGTSSMHPSGAEQEFLDFKRENEIALSDGFVTCPSFEVILAESFSCLAATFPTQCSTYVVNANRMLQLAMGGMNSRTELEVRRAVELMAANFGVEVPLPGSPPRSFRVRLGNVLRRLATASRGRNLHLKRSLELGVLDIDDAALVAHVISMRYKRDGLLLRATRRIFGEL